MYNAIKLLSLAALLLLSTSGCQFDDYLSIPYGTYPLKSIDFTNLSFFNPDYYSGDAIITPGECELLTDQGRPVTLIADLCFPENIEVSIKRGLTYELSYVVVSDTGFVRKTAAGSFQYNEGFLVLTNNGGNGPRRIDYNDDEVTIFGVSGNHGDPDFIYER